MTTQVSCIASVYAPVISSVDKRCHDQFSSRQVAAFGWCFRPTPGVWPTCLQERLERCMIRRWSSIQRLTVLLTGWDTGQLPATSLGCTPSAPHCSPCRMRWLGGPQVSQRRLIFRLKILKTLKRASPAPRRHQSLRRLSACTSLPGCHRRLCGTPHQSHGQSKRAAMRLTQARLSH